ncbi:MAG: MBL fold metallo-hydrolase, partial [Desulfomonilia bacterium]|nr:MBL fold metallo-hydrolase [Desulfomonilia bacterium]
MRRNKRLWTLISAAIAIFLALYAGAFLVLGDRSFATAVPGEETGHQTMRQIAQEKRHHSGKRFVNPFSPGRQGNMLEVLKWKLFAENEFKDSYRDERVKPVSIDWQEVKDHASVSVTFITHATVLIKDNESYLLVDPVLFGLFWPIKNFTPLEFPLDSMPRPDLVLITHGHYDHLDIRSLSLFTGDATFISPLGYARIFQDMGARSFRELDWYDTYYHEGREITLLPANHWTMRNPTTGPNTKLWGSYLIKTSSGPTIFISGDTAYYDGFKEIGREFDIDLAIFSLGAYEPRWFMKKSHIDPEDTVKAFQELRAKKLMIV